MYFRFGFHPGDGPNPEKHDRGRRRRDRLRIRVHFHGHGRYGYAGGWARSPAAISGRGNFRAVTAAPREPGPAILFRGAAKANGTYRGRSSHDLSFRENRRG